MLTYINHPAGILPEAAGLSLADCQKGDGEAQQIRSHLWCGVRGLRGEMRVSPS